MVLTSCRRMNIWMRKKKLQEDEDLNEDEEVEKWKIGAGVITRTIFMREVMKQELFDVWMKFHRSDQRGFWIFFCFISYLLFLSFYRNVSCRLPSAPRRIVLSGNWRIIKEPLTKMWAKPHIKVNLSGCVQVHGAAAEVTEDKDALNPSTAAAGGGPCSARSPACRRRGRRKEKKRISDYFWYVFSLPKTNRKYL